jgi:hypothetical protein
MAPRSRHPFALALLLVGLGVAPGLVACSSDGGDADAGQDAAETPTSEAAPEVEDDPRLALRGPIEVSEPVTGGSYGVPYLAMPEGWEEEYGYVEEERFLTGQATSYGTEEPLAADGRWTLFERDDDTPAPYVTRMIVRRPADAADFNGTVVVEWLNVSAGRDSDPDFGFMAEELLSQGYGYAAVSAQQIGVEPGGLGIEVPNVPPEALYPLKEWDPERYGELSHPGDEYSYDIYSQAARSLLEVDDAAPLGGLRAEHLLAVGESQSSFRLTSYVNGVQPRNDLFDGFFIHSRGDGAADLGPDELQKAPRPVEVRTDSQVPVLQFETETDLELLGHVNARQDDGDVVRTWEVAGTAHADRSTLDYAVSAGARWTDANVDLSSSCGTINDGPQQPVVQAALAALRAWVVDGTVPPESPRFELDDAGAIARDADGLALGAIRTPAVEAPISVLSGTNTTPSVICSLFGSSEPFTPEQLAERYGEPDAYVEQVRAAAEQTAEDGFLLPRHVDELVETAEAVDF